MYPLLTVSTSVHSLPGAVRSLFVAFFFFNDTATTEIYTLSLHDALPIYPTRRVACRFRCRPRRLRVWRSEEHTSELQSPCNIVCRLLLEKKKKNVMRPHADSLRGLDPTPGAGREPC